MSASWGHQVRLVVSKPQFGRLRLPSRRRKLPFSGCGATSTGLRNFHMDAEPYSIIVDSSRTDLTQRGHALCSP